MTMLHTYTIQQVWLRLSILQFSFILIAILTWTVTPVRNNNFIFHCYSLVDFFILICPPMYVYFKIFNDSHFFKCYYLQLNFGDIASVIQSGTCLVFSSFNPILLPFSIRLFAVFLNWSSVIPSDVSSNTIYYIIYSNFDRIVQNTQRNGAHFSRQTLKLEIFSINTSKTLGESRITVSIISSKSCHYLRTGSLLPP